MYSHLTDYQRTSGSVKATKEVFVTVRQSNMYSHLTIYQRTSGSAKQLCWFCHCETIKDVQSPYWLPKDQCSFKSNIVGFVTVRQSNMYSHLTDNQRISGPVKANVRQSNMYNHLTDNQKISGPVKPTVLILSLWDNQTWTVTSLITRESVVL